MYQEDLKDIYLHDSKLEIKEDDSDDKSPDDELDYLMFNNYPYLFENKESDDEDKQEEIYVKKLMEQIFNEFENLLEKKENKSSKEKFYALLINYNRYLYYWAGLENRRLAARKETQLFYNAICAEEKRRETSIKAYDKLKIIYKNSKLYPLIERFRDKIAASDRYAEEELYKKLLKDVKNKKTTNIKNKAENDITQLFREAEKNILQENKQLDPEPIQRILNTIIEELKQKRLSKTLPTLPEIFYSKRDQYLFTDKDKPIVGCNIYPKELVIYAVLKAQNSIILNERYKEAVFHFEQCKKCRKDINKISYLIEKKGYQFIRNPFDKKQKHISLSKVDVKKVYKENFDGESPSDELGFIHYLLLMIYKGEIKKAKQVWQERKKEFPMLYSCFQGLEQLEEK